MLNVNVMRLIALCKLDEFLLFGFFSSASSDLLSSSSLSFMTSFNFSASSLKIENKVWVKFYFYQLKVAIHAHLLSSTSPENGRYDEVYNNDMHFNYCIVYYLFLLH